MRPTVLLAQPLDEDAEARLRAAADVVVPGSPGEDDVAALLPGCDALIVRTGTPVTRSLIEAGDRLRVIGVAGVGLDHVDVEAARRRGVLVLNRPEASSDAVAEFAVALMLQLLRPVDRLSRAYARGRFDDARRAPHGRELCGLSVGIVGMGRIGSRVGRICAAGFGARVLYNDIRPVGPFAFEARAVDKERIWRECDVVTLHVPLTAQTRGLVDARVLASFRPQALLINTARGAVVRTDALLDALHTSRLAGAALDVTDPEPLPPDHPLWELPQCILTPHVASRTSAAMRRMFDVVDDVLDALRTGPARPSPG